MHDTHVAHISHTHVDTGTVHRVAHTHTRTHLHTRSHDITTHTRDTHTHSYVHYFVHTFFFTAHMTHTHYYICMTGILILWHVFLRHMSFSHICHFCHTKSQSTYTTQDTFFVFTHGYSVCTCFDTHTTHSMTHTHRHSLRTHYSVTHHGDRHTHTHIQPCVNV